MERGWESSSLLSPQGMEYIPSVLWTGLWSSFGVECIEAHAFPILNPFQHIKLLTRISLKIPPASPGDGDRPQVSQSLYRILSSLRQNP